MNFLKTSFAHPLFLFLNIGLSIAYFVFIAFLFPIGNPVLFGFLILGEVFHLWQVFGYIHAVWPRKRESQFDESFTPAVAVYITVTGEPSEIVEETVKAATEMDYPNFNVYILNDGFVANRDNWREAEEVADKYGIKCITRKKNTGFIVFTVKVSVSTGNCIRCKFRN